MNLSAEEQQVIDRLQNLIKPGSIKEAGPEGLGLMGVALIAKSLTLDKTMFDDVQEFHDMLGLEKRKKIHAFPAMLQRFRTELLDEELTN